MTHPPKEPAREALLELLALLADLASSGPEDDDVRVTQGADGSTVVEFGDGVHGRRPPSGEAVTVRYRGSGGFASQVLADGRATRVPAGPAPPGGALGVHRGVVESAVDPVGERRLLVRIPSVLGDRAVWALACLPVGVADELPNAGDAVWVAFEAADASRPVWLGRAARS